jgi:hypothetical protein
MQLFIWYLSVVGLALAISSWALAGQADDVDDGHYRTVRSANKRYALVIETDGRFVTRLRAGMVPAVEYVEGCN